MTYTPEFNDDEKIDSQGILQMKKLVLLLLTITIFSTQAKSDVCNEQVTYGFNKFKMSDYSCANEPQENLTCYSANAQTNNLNVPYAISVEYCKLDRGYKWKAQKFDKDFTVKDGLTTFYVLNEKRGDIFDCIYLRNKNKTSQRVVLYCDGDKKDGFSQEEVKNLINQKKDFVPN